MPFENSTAREFACVQFTYDSKYLVAVTGEPDWYLYYYNWDKGKVESHAKAQNPSGQGTVESVSVPLYPFYRTIQTSLLYVKYKNNIGKLLRLMTISLTKAAQSFFLNRL